jgi:predicted transposase/invertase (TIGR01784 family)
MKKEKDVSKRILISFDWFIKKLLRHKSNYVILEGFLSELLKKDIFIQEILESETNKEESNDKSSKVDILCKYTDDELIIIELQFFGDIDYFQRILFTASKTITNYLAEGAKYELVKKI